MPGSSLWLVPREDSELYKTIHDLITNKIPSIYPIAVPRHFAPHITLTSGINNPNAESSDPQKWLDSITLPDPSNLEIAIQDVEVGSVFFKKITMKCQKTHELCELAATCRAAGVEGLGKHEAQTWVKENYLPHCSLMYSDLPEDEAKKKFEEVYEKVQEAKQNSQSKTAKGAVIWLVPTYKTIEEWKPVAKRHLPDTEWSWPT